MDILLILLFFLFIFLIVYRPVPITFIFAHSVVSIIIFVASFIIITEELRESGVITNAAIFLIRKTRGNARVSIIIFLILAGITSAFVMNDVAIFIFVPLATSLAKILKVEKYKLVSLTAISINIGSSLTPIGNPQNIIIWKYFDIDFILFISAMMPFYLILTGSLIVYSLFLININKKEMIVPEYVQMHHIKAVITIILMVLVIILAELNYDLIGLVITLIMILIIDRKILKFIKPTIILLIFFMICDFRMLANIIVIPKITQPVMLFIISDVLSQLISNVPSTCLLLTYSNEWIPLAYGVNHGGIGFFIGSLANIIALKLSDVSIGDYHRVSLPLYMITFIIFITYIIMIEI